MKKLAVSLFSFVLLSSVASADRDSKKKSPHPLAKPPAEDRFRAMRADLEAKLNRAEVERRNAHTQLENAERAVMQVEAAIRQLEESQHRAEIAAMKAAIFALQETVGSSNERAQRAWEESEQKKKSDAAASAQQRNQIAALHREIHELEQKLEALARQRSTPRPPVAPPVPRVRRP